MSSEVKDFTIPSNPSELLENKEDSFCVKQQIEISSQSASDIKSLLTEVETALQERKAFSITSNDVFDVVYGFIHDYNILEVKTKIRLYEILQRGLKELANSIDSLFPQGKKSKIAEDEESVSLHRNALKMYIYLLNWLVNLSEKEQAQQEAENAVATAAKKGRSRTTKKKATSSGDGSALESSIDDTLSAMTKALKEKLGRLWKNDKIEEAVISLFFKTCTTILQNLKSKSLKESVFKLVVATIQNSSENSITGVAVSTLDMIMKYDVIGTYIVELIEEMIGEDDRNVSAFIAELFRELGAIESEDLNQDANGAKNLCAFLMDVAERLPSIAMSNLSMLIMHLDDDSYTVRNAIVHCISRIIKLKLVQDSSETAKKTRDQLLEILEERIRDTNAYTRSKTLQCWSYLIEEKAVPLKYLPSVVDAIIGRIMDKSAFVRKSAVQFVKTAIEHNPYGYLLKKESFKTQKEEAAQKLQKAEEDLLKFKAELEDEELTEEQQAKQAALEKEILKHKKEKEYASNAITFIQQLSGAVPAACELLDSKTSSDIIECIDLFVCATTFRVDTAVSGVKKMLRLVWSKEQSVQEAAVDAVERIFFSSQSLKSVEACIDTAKELIHTISTCTLAELAALEEIIINLVKKESFPHHVTLALWEVFSNGIPGTTPTDSAAAAILLKAIALANPQLIKKKFKLLVKEGLGERAKECPYLAIHTCSILESLKPSDSQTPVIDESDEEDEAPKRGRKKATKKKSTSKPKAAESDETKLGPEHALFVRLFDLLVGDYFKTEVWLPFAEKAINTIYALCANPIQIMKDLTTFLANKSKQTSRPSVAPSSVQAVAQAETQEESASVPPVNTETSTQEQPQQTIQVSSAYLTKLFFILGHSSLKDLVLLEDSHKQAKKMLESTKKSNAKEENTANSLEAELGLDVNGMDEHEIDQKYEQLEKNLIVGEESVYAPHVPLIIAISSDPDNKYKGSLLRRSAILTLCKFMCASHKFCADNLQLLFTILASATTPPSVRSNIIISVGDMACRFPNTVEPWTPYMYQGLRDAHLSVRKNSFMVLSHLILNDMVKMKSNISEIARCIEDTDLGIQNLCKSFFNELSRKHAQRQNNPIYNLLPEILSRLSSSEDLSTESFKNIMKFILSFITKDKQTEQLVEKLCQRFKAWPDEMDQWRALIYCLSLLNINNEKSLRKLVENLKYYQHALVDEEVVKVLQEIGDKAKKSVTKDFKKDYEEWEQKVIDINEKLSADKEYYEQLKSGSKRIKAEKNAELKKEQEAANSDEEETSRSRAKPKARKSKKKVSFDSEDEVETLPLTDDEEEEEDEEAPKKKATKSRARKSKKKDDDDSDDEPKKSKRKPRARVSKKKKQDSDEDEDEDEEVEKVTKKTSRARTSKKSKNDSDEDEEEKPKRGRKRQPAKKRGRKSKDEEEEDEEDEMPSEEEPVDDEPANEDSEEEGKKAKRHKVYKSPSVARSRSLLQDTTNIKLQEDLAAITPPRVFIKKEVTRKPRRRTAIKGKENEVA